MVRTGDPPGRQSIVCGLKSEIVPIWRYFTIQQLQHLDVVFILSVARSDSEVSVRISLDNLHRLDLTMTTLVEVSDLDDRVDVGVALLHHLGQVVDDHLGVMKVDLLHSDVHSRSIMSLGSECVGHPPVLSIDCESECFIF